MKDYLNEINPNIPLVHGLRNSIFNDAWCETKFGKVPIFCPLAYQCKKLGNNFNVYVNIGPMTSSSPSTNATYPLQRQSAESQPPKFMMFFIGRGEWINMLRNLLKEILQSPQHRTSFKRN